MHRQGLCHTSPLWQHIALYMIIFFVHQRTRPGDKYDDLIPTISGRRMLLEEKYRSESHVVVKATGRMHRNDLREFSFGSNPYLISCFI